MPAPFGPPGGGMPPQQQKKKQLPPKLFGGWTATLEDPESYQSQTIDRAEARLGGEEAIDETQPKEIFKGLNASEQMRRARQLQQMNAMGGMPVRESRKPRPGSNRWWNNINEKVTNNPEIGKFFSEQIDKVLINEDRQHFPGTPGGPYISPEGYDTPPYLAPTQQGRPVVTPPDMGEGLSGRDLDLWVTPDDFQEYWDQWHQDNPGGGHYNPFSGGRYNYGRGRFPSPRPGLMWDPNANGKGKGDWVVDPDYVPRPWEFGPFSPDDPPPGK